LAYSRKLGLLASAVARLEQGLNVIECISLNVDMNNIIVLSYGRLYFRPIHDVLPCHLNIKKGKELETE
jgi:hypothetical protein